MKQTLFIFMLLCFISKFGFCQLFNQLDSAFKKTTTVNELETYFSKLKADTTLTSVRKEINRSIDFNYKQTIYSLQWEYLQYEIYLVERNDTIVFGKLQELDYFKEDKIINSDLYTAQTKMLHNYLLQYFSYYKIKVSDKNFIEQMTTKEVFGFGCGLHRTGYSEAAKKSMKYVNTKNYEGLSNMLVSIVPEIKAYGARGLIQLEKNGLPIKGKEKIIIAHYKQMNFEVYSCYGCLSGPESFLSVLEYNWGKE